MEEILIVDDEEAVRDMLAAFVRIAGYPVYCASNGQEAKALLRTHSQIDFAIIDLMMPDIEGTVLAKQLLLTKKELTIMFMTGYSERVLGKEYLEENALVISHNHILHKPTEILEWVKNLCRARTD